MEYDASSARESRLEDKDPEKNSKEEPDEEAVVGKQDNIKKLVTPQVDDLSMEGNSIDADQSYSYLNLLKKQLTP